MAHLSAADARCATGPGLGQPPSVREPSRAALEVAAELNRRFAQLAWPGLAEVDAGDDDRHQAVDVRRVSGAEEGPATHFPLGDASVAADVDRILDRLREQGWDRAAPAVALPGLPRRERWCVPE